MNLHISICCESPIITMSVLINSDSAYIRDMKDWHKVPITVTYINLAYLGLTKLPDLSQLKNLKTLHLNSNKLENIDIEKLHNLTFLDISNNKMSDSVLAEIVEKCKKSHPMLQIVVDNKRNVYTLQK